MPLVKWDLTPIGHCWPKEEYASVIASIIHLDSLSFVTGHPLVRLPKHTKSFSDCVKGAEGDSTPGLPPKEEVPRELSPAL